MLTIFALQLLHGCSYIGKLANELTEDPYDIDVIYVDWTPTASQEADIDAALALWESAITEGLIEATYNTTQEEIDAVTMHSDGIEALDNPEVSFVYLLAPVGALGAFYFPVLSK